MTEPREFALFPLYEIVLDFFCAGSSLAADVAPMFPVLGESDARRTGRLFELESVADAGTVELWGGSD